jgi:formylmethanofuran dehydrogenase subunit E
MATRIAGRDPARRCRRCGEPIELDDLFGLSETVCRACRGERLRPLRTDVDERRAA